MAQVPDLRETFSNINLMLRVGLTGGLASGKTFVGHALRDLGCYLIQADELGHQVLQPGGEAYDAVIHAFGSDILDQDAFIDRHKLAAQAASEVKSDADPAQGF